MPGGTFKSARIFYMPYQEDAIWDLLDTSVQSGLLPESKLFARGVFDLAAAVEESALTLPVKITLTIAPYTGVAGTVGGPTVNQQAGLRLLTDTNLITVDSSQIRVNSSSWTYTIP